jgi:hypothetical protein
MHNALYVMDRGFQDEADCLEPAERDRALPPGARASGRLGGAWSSWRTVTVQVWHAPERARVRS